MSSTVKKRPAQSPARKKAVQPRKSVKQPVKRSVKKAAENVQTNAERARELGQAMTKAGELLQQGALFLELMAERAATTRKNKSKR